MRQLKALNEKEIESGKALSTWNGYKLMSMDVTDAAVHCDRTFPRNVEGVVGENPHERGHIFHDFGGAGKGPGEIYLTPGPLSIGSDDTSEVPKDIWDSTARVAAHSHPYTGQHVHDAPSMADQIIAREFPHVEHIVQTPAANRTAVNPYIIYNGALPPRYYTLVENPFNLPVPPHSPDSDRLPPFHPYPSNI
jgi:hypothetical protein